MEKVYLTPEDIIEIGKGNIPTLNDFNEVWKHITLHGFMFDGFWIILEKSNIKYQVVIDKAIDFMPVVKIKKVWYQNDMPHHIDLTMPIYLYRLKYIEMMDNNNAADENMKESLIPMMFMQYVTYSMLHRDIEFIDPEIRNSNPSTTSRSSHTKAKYSLTECIKIYRHRNKNKKYEYHIESWLRRGTVRHLKSGKIVPVSGSVCRPKNKGTGTPDKEYRL